MSKSLLNEKSMKSFFKLVKEGSYTAKDKNEFDIKPGMIIQNQYDGIKVKVIGVYDNSRLFIIFHDKKSISEEFTNKEEMESIYGEIDCINLLEIGNYGGLKFFECWEECK